MLLALVLCQLKVLYIFHRADGTLVRLVRLCIVTGQVQIQRRLADVRAVAAFTAERIRIAVLLHVIQCQCAIEELLAAALDVAGHFVLDAIVRDGVAQLFEARVAQIAVHLEKIAEAHVLLGQFGC